MREALAAIATMALLAGCGDDEPRTVTETRTVTVTEEPRQTETVPTTDAAPPTATPGPPGDCGRRGGLRLEVVNGAVPCSEAQRIAGGYDLQGPKVQEVGNWTCASGTAATRPIVFTCTLGDRELVAKEGGD